MVWCFVTEQQIRLSNSFYLKSIKCLTFNEFLHVSGQKNSIIDPSIYSLWSSENPNELEMKNWASTLATIVSYTDRKGVNFEFMPDYHMQITNDISSVDNFY